MSFAAVVQRLQTLENPYPGLRPFDVDESHLFFGRDVQVAELVARLERHRLVAVLGVSGSGKSSLVRAGLIPALERGGVWEAGRRWRQVVTQPAGAPFDSLAADLRKAGLDASRLRESSHGIINVARQLPEDESLLLVVDQFEELFRYKDVPPITAEARRTRERHAADAADFVQLLLEAGRHYPPIYIVITMRSDYLGDCAEFRDLPETLNDCQYLIPRMTRQQRQEAIEGPLGRVKIAPSLVQRMLNDAGDEPDQLPVLQHALMRTWNQWRPNASRPIDITDYEAVGGFDGALNQHADELLRTVDPRIAACVFKRLTARGRGGRERRDPAKLAELWAVCDATAPAARAEVTAVIDRFRSGEATFLRPLAGAIGPDTYVDITHESLIRLWKQLRDEWLPDEQRSAKTLVEVAERARNWTTGKGELLTGLDLARVVTWDRQRNRTDAWAHHYVDEASARDLAEFVAASRARERRRALIRRAAWSAVAVVVLAVAILVGLSKYRSIVAERERNAAARAEAERARREAEARQDVAEQDLLRAQTDLVQPGARSRPATAGGSDAALPRPAPPPLTGGGRAGVARGSVAAPAVAPRVYIQVRSADEAARARELARPLQQAGFVVPRPEILQTGPSANEVRYFRADERKQAEEIVRVLRQARVPDPRIVYVKGYEDSKNIRDDHFELWLVPADVLPGLVQQLNDPSPDVRKTAGARLARDYADSPDAIRTVLDSLSERNLKRLSVDGLINALYFLNRSEERAWTDPQRKHAREAIDRVRAAGAVGPQTEQELQMLERKVSGRVVDRRPPLSARREAGEASVPVTDAAARQAPRFRRRGERRQTSCARTASAGTCSAGPRPAWTSRS